MTQNQNRLTRRRALATAAWSAPVIVAASAAPAYATSSGAAVLRAPDPSFNLLGNRITIISIYTNFGTGPAASMMVTATLTPTVGTLIDQNPTVSHPDFSFVSKTTSPTGAQVLTFTKVNPQIPAGDEGRLQFEVNMNLGAGNLRVLEVALVPTVPPPSTAAASQNTLTHQGLP